MAFYGCDSLTQISIPSSVTKIGDNAFYGCISLKDIVLPNSVKSLGEYAFDGCSSLETVTLSDSITTIKEKTFFNCYRLFEITLPKGLKTIEDRAFCNCFSLKEVRLPKSVKNIHELAFSRMISVFSGNEEALKGLVIQGDKGSYGETFAEKYDYDFEPANQGKVNQAVVYPTSFSDIKRGSDYYAAVTKLAKLGAIGGYADGSFKPSKAMTGEDFICILMRTLDDDLPRAVKGSDRDSRVIERAIQIGILSEQELSAIQNGQTLTYQDMVMYVVKAMEELTFEEFTIYENLEVVIPQFAKVKGTKYEDYFKKIYAAGVYTERDKNAPKLQDKVTRGQGIRIIHRVIDNVYRETITPREIREKRPVVTLKWNDPDRLLPKIGDTWIDKNGKKTVLTGITEGMTEVPGYGQGIDLYSGLAIPYGKKEPLKNGGEGITWHDDDTFHGDPFIVAKDSKGVVFAYFKRQWRAIQWYEGTLAAKIKNPKDGQMAGHFTKYYSKYGLWGWVGPLY